MYNEPEYTQVCEDRDFAEWHGGCPWCAVWVLRVDSLEVDARVARARQRLAPWLLPRYERQPHITLAYRGLMAEQGGAEFAAAQLQADVLALKHAQLQPFTARLRGIGSFSTVPYFSVEADTPLQEAHEALASAQPYVGWHYVPHVTLGHYSRQVPMATVMTAWQAAEPDLDVAVNALWLARYRTHDIAGPLSYEGRFDLQTQTHQAQPDALLQR